MVRPGPKTTQNEVKTAVVKLLEKHSEGLNFNEVFRRLKEQKVLGSFSVLARAMKDLRKAGVVKYKDVQVSRYKIPKRIYMLSEPMERMLKQLYIKEKEKVALKEIVLKETLLHHLFLTHINNLIAAYRYLLHEENPSDENARWKIILNLNLIICELSWIPLPKLFQKVKYQLKKLEKWLMKFTKKLCSD